MFHTIFNNLFLKLWIRKVNFFKPIEKTDLIDRNHIFQNISPVSVNVDVCELEAG